MADIIFIAKHAVKVKKNFPQKLQIWPPKLLLQKIIGLNWRPQNPYMKDWRWKQERQEIVNSNLREMCPNTKFFRSVFSCIRTEYGDLLRKSCTGLRPATLLKKGILAQVFSCKFCEISKNAFFTDNLLPTASVL